MALQFLGANQNFVGHSVQQIVQLLPLLEDLDLRQKHPCVCLLLHETQDF